MMQRSIPDSRTSLNPSSDNCDHFKESRAHNPEATDHMEVSAPSSSWSPASSTTPPEIQFNDPDHGFHPASCPDQLVYNVMDPTDAQLLDRSYPNYPPSTSRFFNPPGITTNEASSSKGGLRGRGVSPFPLLNSPDGFNQRSGTIPLSRFHHDAVPNRPNPQSREQYKEQWSPRSTIPQTRGSRHTSPFITEDQDYKRNPEAMRPWKEDYTIYTRRAKTKGTFKELRRAKRRNLDAGPEYIPQQMDPSNRSSMQNAPASTVASTQRGPAQPIVESSPFSPDDTVRRRGHAVQDFSILRNLQKADVSGLFVNTHGPLGPVNIYHDYGSTSATSESSRSEHSEYEMYYQYLSVRKRGTPLWEPGPHLNLPPEYREKGVSNGDVGILNSTTGVFTFLFNVFLSSSHEINRGRVPNGFIPLDRSKAERNMKKNDLYDRCLSSSSLSRTGAPDFVFQTTGREGAVLVMPDGGLSEDLQNVRLMESYIAAYSESWWEYVDSEDCGVPTENGIQVVVGTDKVPSWGMAAFQNVEEPIQFEFKCDNTASQIRTWKRINGRAWPTENEMRVGPTASPCCNQCVFVRMLNVSIPAKVRDGLALEVCSSCSRDCRCMPHPNRHEGQSTKRNVEIRSSEAGRSHISHPSKFLNKYLSEKCPNAKVIITSDSDWISVITEDDTTMPSIEDICARVLRSHIICETEGVVTLRNQNDVTTGVKDDPSVTGSSATLGNDEWSKVDSTSKIDDDSTNELGPSPIAVKPSLTASPDTTFASNTICVKYLLAASPATTDMASPEASSSPSARGRSPFEFEAEKCVSETSIESTSKDEAPFPRLLLQPLNTRLYPNDLPGPIPGPIPGLLKKIESKEGAVKFDDRKRQKTTGDGQHDRRTCLGCGVTSTPELRLGPLGPRTLCHVCGVVYARMMQKRNEYKPSGPKKSSPGNSAEFRVIRGTKGGRMHGQIAPEEPADEKSGDKSQTDRGDIVDTLQASRSASRVHVRRRP